VAATILYIEDNPQNMRLARKMLHTAGYQVIEAVDGMSGLHTVMNESVDLVLVDINLPDIDGLQVTAQIKSMPELASLPVLALTANAMHGDRERCLAAGCDGYIPKPVTKNELLTMVAHFLGESERRVV